MKLHQLTSNALLVLMLGLLAACSDYVELDLEQITAAEIGQFNQQENQVFSSGQPTEEQLGVLADAGIMHIISLRTEGEIDWDEAAVVESLGMEFHSLPVSGATLNSENAQSLENLLASLDGQPTLLHCGSSNRVGALKAIFARDSGTSVEESLAIGRQWGMTGLEERVRGIFNGS